MVFLIFLAHNDFFFYLQFMDIAYFITYIGNDCYLSDCQVGQTKCSHDKLG